MEQYQPIDAEGCDLEIGDWIRVIAVPLSIRGMPKESLQAFSMAVGHTFQIEAFDEAGCLELDMYPKISCDTIYIEPYCVNRYRRYKKISKAFQHKLDIRNAPEIPKYKFVFEAILKPGVDIEVFGQNLIFMGTGGGFAVYPAKRRITGSVSIEKNEPDAIEILENAKKQVEKSKEIESIEVSDIIETK
jgi:hypothetical protein